MYVFCQTRASLENAMFSCRTRGTTIESIIEMHCSVGAKLLERPMNMHQAMVGPAIRQPEDIKADLSCLPVFNWMHRAPHPW
jgi:hypothetical protein